MALGIQDAKERGIDWVNQEYNRLLEDLDRDANYFNVIRIAKEQLDQEGERQEVQAQKLAEVDEMALPFDIDKELETAGINDLVRQMLKEERAKNFEEFNAEFDRIQAETAEKIRGYEEREVILERNNSELQEQIREDEQSLEKMYNETKALREQIERLSADNAALKQENHDLKQRNEEIDQNRTNAARIILERDAEIERLEAQVDELRRVNAIGERQAQRVIEVTETAKNLFEQAKQATAAKRQVKVVGNIGANFLTVENPDKTTDVIHVSAIDRDEVEVVTEFLTPPEIVFEQEPIGTQYDVEESPVVFGGIEDPSACDLVEEVREAAFTETVEATQETAYSEEVGETVSRAEFDALRKDVEKLKAHVGFVEIGHGEAA